MLEKTGRFAVDITYEPSKTLADVAALAKYRAIVLDYNGPLWGEPAQTNFLAAVQRGAGVAVIHAANNAFPGWVEYEKLVGDCWRDGTGHGAFHAFDLKIVDPTHPITRALGQIRAHPDELYHDLVRTPGAQHATLASAFSSKDSGGTGQDEPMILVAQYGQGRVFHTPLGHVWPGVESTRASHDDPQFQRLIARGVEWVATGDVVDGEPASAADSDWTTLFGGQDISAWRGFKQRGFPDRGWTVREGALVCIRNGGGGDLITREKFADFELEFEWRATEKANSGVMYRVAELGPQAPAWFSGPEYQVLDNAYFGDKIDYAHAAGAIYDICPADPAAPSLPVGQWNKGRIVVQGWRVAHYLNGVLVAACDFGSDDGKARVQKSKFATLTNPLQFMTNAKGHIALQDHGDEVAYRSIRVRPLKTSSIQLFNGRDLTGWTWVGKSESKIADVWSVDAAGELVCKGEPAGYIRTVADYTNYVLELDWRWNPAAGGNRNSGVLLRMIEEDGVWPKSLEAQLMDGNAGDFWIIREFPATTDPARTNGRNCKKTHANEKPAGEWNHYKITVDHGTVTLEVNGQVLNVAQDVLEVPGKICLQSEGAEIRFKNVVLTPLP
jgi:type 1 glutamine amidotransferase